MTLLKNDTVYSVKIKFMTVKGVGDGEGVGGTFYADKRRLYYFFSISNSFRDISMRNFCTEQKIICFRVFTEWFVLLSKCGLFRMWHSLFYHLDDWLLLAGYWPCNTGCSGCNFPYSQKQPILSCKHLSDPDQPKNIKVPAGRITADCPVRCKSVKGLRRHDLFVCPVRI